MLVIFAAAIAAGLIGFGVAILMNGEPVERWQFEGTMLVAMGALALVVAAGMTRR